MHREKVFDEVVKKKFYVLSLQNPGLKKAPKLSLLFLSKNWHFPNICFYAIWILRKVKL